MELAQKRAAELLDSLSSNVAANRGLS